VSERHLRKELLVPRPIGEVFPFFAQARNLEVLTPPWLKFEILTPDPITMRAGLNIDYRIHLHGLPVRWRTEIAEWEPPHRVVDRQVRGPYRLWHHRHTFEERGNATLCRDEVRYWPIGGAVVDALFVRRDGEAIFSFRRRSCSKVFARPRPREWPRRAGSV
jgi:ligand-binding SRPBCC domain-containing protein